MLCCVLLFKVLGLVCFRNVSKFGGLFCRVWHGVGGWASLLLLGFQVLFLFVLRYCRCLCILIMF